MLLWYVGLSAAAVWIVFRDPRIDFRLLAVGALLPLLIDAPTGEKALGHTLLVSVGTLAAVVAATPGRRPARPRLLMLPIGMLLHLAFDGMWTTPDTFWWPFLGGELEGGELLPGLGTVLVREAVGLLVIVWFVRRFGLTDPDARRRLWRTGQVEVTEP